MAKTDQEKQGSKKNKPTRRREPEEVRARIVSAAIGAFANQGIDGASLRKISDEAQVSQSLLLYHFSSKEELWRAVMERAFRKAEKQIEARKKYNHLSASDQLRHVIKEIVLRYAETPELHRLMILESHQLTDRLRWMYERYLKMSSRQLIQLISDAQKEGGVRKGDPARLRFAIISTAAIPFTNAGEYQLITNKNPFSPSEIKKTTELINSIIFIS